MRELIKIFLKKKLDVAYSYNEMQLIYKPNPNKKFISFRSHVNKNTHNHLNIVL